MESSAESWRQTTVSAGLFNLLSKIILRGSQYYDSHFVIHLCVPRRSVPFKQGRHLHGNVDPGLSELIADQPGHREQSNQHHLLGAGLCTQGLRNTVRESAGIGDGAAGREFVQYR